MDCTTPQTASTEMMGLVQRLETVLYEVYQSDGVDLGMTFGKAAHRGFTGHIHMHVLSLDAPIPAPSPSSASARPTRLWRPRLGG